MKIAINGFGRLGRCIARVALSHKNCEIVGINDIANKENLAYLFQFDSTHGKLLNSNKTEIKVSINDDKLVLLDSRNTIEIPFFNCKNPQDLDFGALGADVVIESSGLFLDSSLVSHHLKKGVKKVIISAPATDLTPTFVLGVNHKDYKGENIISNASCTTNCLAPIAMILDREFGIKKATLSTIHSYTNDQKLLDVPHNSEKRRSRAAALNIIPTSTGAAKALYKVLPNLKDKIHGHSLRVPIADVSMVDLNAYLEKSVEAKTLNDLFLAESNNNLKGILGVDSEFGVSSDFVGDTRSSIVAKDLTFSLENMVKVMSWYDNEWGYSNRIIEMSEFILS